MKVEEMIRKTEKLAENLKKLDDYELMKIDGYVECMIAMKKLRELEEEVKEPA